MQGPLTRERERNYDRHFQQMRREAWRLYRVNNLLLPDGIRHRVLDMLMRGRFPLAIRTFEYLSRRTPSMTPIGTHSDILARTRHFEQIENRPPGFRY